MTAPRDPDRLIEAFLEDGTDNLPDWAFDEVRHDIHRTRQRVAIGPWRDPVMSNLARYGVIAAAVVLLVGAGVVLFRPAPSGVAAPASVAPSASPSASPTEAAAASPSLRPDAAVPGPNSIGIDGATLTLTLPEGSAGWSNHGNHLEKDYGGSVGPAVFPAVIRRTYVDPCTDHTLKEPAPQGVEQVIAAVANQPGIASKPATDVTISGYSGQYVDTTVTGDTTLCGGQDMFWLFAGAPGEPWPVGGTGEMYRLYALDVDGTTVTFAVRIPEDTSDADLADVMAVLETVEIEPVAASPSP